MDPESIQGLQMLKRLMYQDPNMVLGERWKSSNAPLKDVGNGASKRAKTTKTKLTAADVELMKATDECILKSSKNVRTYALSCFGCIHNHLIITYSIISRHLCKNTCSKEW